MTSIRRVQALRWRPQIENLQAACLPSDDPYPLRAADLWFLAFDGATPVAFAVAHEVRGEPGVWYMARCGVLPSHRGHGIQQRLIRARWRGLLALSGHTALTDCTNTNTASARSLIRGGFLPYSPQRRWALGHSIYWKRTCNSRTCPPPPRPTA